MERAAVSALERGYRAATACIEEGDPGGATRALLPLLDEIKDPTGRLHVLNLLSSVHVRTGRVMEALPIAREVALRARRLEVPKLELSALGTVCNSLYGLYIGAERRGVIARADELLADWHDAPAGFHLTNAYCHLGQALDDDDLDAARRFLARMWELIPDVGPNDSRLATCSVLAIEAIVDIRSQDPDRALERLDQIASRDVADPHQAPELRVLRVRAQLARGALEDARDAAAFAMEALEEAPAVALSDCILYGSELAGYLENELDDPDSALEAYDLTATAVVRRITQLDESAKLLPQIRLEGAHETELARYRVEFRRAQRSLLDRVGRMLNERVAAGAREVLDRSRKDGLIPVCAWCEAIRDGDNRWLPVGQFLPQDGITSTICPACRIEYR